MKKDGPSRQNRKANTKNKTAQLANKNKYKQGAIKKNEKVHYS